MPDRSNKRRGVREAALGWVVRKTLSEKVTIRLGSEWQEGATLEMMRPATFQTQETVSAKGLR